MSILLNGDCLEEMENLDNESIDLIFCDLPYGQTSCKWDCLIDIDKLWIQFMRVKKLNTPIIMTCTTKFGLSLLNSCPKKCPFRYDLVWCKSAPAGFLSAKKMPMRKHEMIYVFYEKLPFYDLSSHKHKFIKERDTKQKNGKIYEEEGNNKKIIEGKYDPPLPTSLIKEDEPEYDGTINTLYSNNIDVPSYVNKRNKKTGMSAYDPPLPTSLIKEDCPEPEPEPKIEDVYKATERFKNGKLKKNPRHLQKGDDPIYDPPLPTSLIKEGGSDGSITEEYNGNYGKIKQPDYIINNVDRNKIRRENKKKGLGESAYEPPLPDSLLEIKSTRGKHSTEKPVALMNWILKYYSKEGDVVLDPTMGSGSMGVACKEMNRDFIGIEKDEEIYSVAVNRIE